MTITNFENRLFEVEDFLDEKKRYFDRKNLLKKAYIPLMDLNKIAEELGGSCEDIFKREWEYQTMIIPFNEGKLIIKFPWLNTDGSLDKRGHEVSYRGRLYPNLQEKVKERLKSVIYT